MFVASAAGRLAAAAAETLVRPATAAQGAQLLVREVRPLPPGDGIGLGVFLFMIACSISGYIAVTVLRTFAPTLRSRRRNPIIGTTAVLTSVIQRVVCHR